MTETTLHLLGYLNEEQWLSAFKKTSTSMEKSEIALVARKVQARYDFRFEKDKLQDLVDNN